ncbi:uncharacterized protein LOC113205308 [Frankliniella occidentalis]|uniref:Uncharacterized protein LOC113205308 n=1 Tax=Frankliniella occidentalis TaxID=133901 RepID=A0A6J1SDE8_FRAOC|nr:uncharacterized protein LOC113205308 [Frankliniella occidentalis]
MECHISRGFLSLRQLSRKAVHDHCNRLQDGRVVFGCLQAVEKRLYHKNSSPHSNSSLCPAARLHSLNLLCSPALSASRSLAFRPRQTRGIVISKIIDAFRNAEITSVEGFSKFIIDSAPVSAIRHFYELMEATTGLPWAANIVLCSFVLQLILNVPANVYMIKWSTGKEKQIGDLIAIKASVMRSPSRDNIAMFAKANTELTRQYGCQTYKFVSTIAYQMLHVTITSFAVRSIFLQPNPDILNAVTPWGTLLAQADPLLVLPLCNFVLSLLLVEVAAWKKSNSEEGLKMTLRRANLPFKGEPLYLLNLRRGVNIPMLLIYGIVPSALNIHWIVMMLASINTQILMSHNKTRRALGIAPCYFETATPYRDFLRHLRNDVIIFNKKKV